MDVKTLRLLARYSQRDAAELAGVSVRTWRRWERTDRPAPVVLRWLRYECGYMPGWPPGFRLERGGIRTPSGQLMPPNIIEAARWVLGFLEARDRERALTAGNTAASSRAPPAPRRIPR